MAEKPHDPIVMPVGDFYNPYFTARIMRPPKDDSEAKKPKPSVVVTNKKGVKAVYFEEKIFEIRNYSSSLIVESRGAAKTFTASLTLSLPYDDALAFVSEPVVRQHSLMELQWGYLNANRGLPLSSPPTYFQIQEPSMTFGLDSTVQVTGKHLAYSSLQSLETHMNYKRSDARFRTDLDVIRFCLKRTAPDFELCVNTGVATDTTLMDVKKENLHQMESDWNFIRRLLHDNGAGFMVTGAKLVIYPIGAENTKALSYAFTFFLAPREATDIPCYTFTTNPTQNLFQGDGALQRGQTVRTRDLDTGKTKTTKMTPETEGSAKTKTGKGGDEKDIPKGKVRPGKKSPKALGVAKKKKDNQDGKQVSQPNRKPNKEQQAKTRMKKYSQGDLAFNQEAHITAPGVPTLEALMIGEMKGVGEKFSGFYRVQDIRHKLGQGYEMEVKLLRSGTTGASGAAETTKKGRKSLVKQKKRTGEVSSNPDAGK